MQKTMKILRVLFCLSVVILAALVFMHPKKTQTNILKAILSNTEKDELLINLSQKHSGRLNVIFESPDPEITSEIQKKFQQELQIDIFKPDISNAKNFKQLLNTYKDYYRNLLSQKTRIEISHNDFEAVKLESLERLYNPLSVNIIPVEQDPFYLFSDYLQSLSAGTNTALNKKNGKFYEVLTLNFKDEIALSPTLLNKEMEKILSLKQKIEKENKDIKIYLAGPPIHTYTASSKSIFEINIISILSVIFIIILCKLYFKSFKILIPVSLSLATGILCGYLLTSLLFDSIHILTFVFSTTLIGICIDYSLHCFVHNNNINSIFNSLTASMATTVCAFLILLFSNIELLRQIAVYTSAGLLGVYLFVILFYPYICKKLECTIDNTYDLSKIFSFKLGKAQRRTIVYVIIFLTIIGLSRIKFNDEIKDMYKPTKELINSEKLYASLNETTTDTKFIITRANNLQSLLEQEENLTRTLKEQDFTALSKFVPTKKQQLENLKLRKILYQTELNNYATFLPQKYKKRLLNENYPPEFLTPDKIPSQISENFLLNDNQSVIILKHTDKSINNLLSQNNNIIFIDLQADISEKVKNCRLNCIKLIFPVAIILFIVMSFVYKPKNTLKIIFPSFLGGLFTLSIPAFFNIGINMFHILSLFLIIGFSLDYSIFRFNNRKNTNKTNEAVLISCATTIFSLFLLSLTSFKLISSLGFMISCGLISSYILSLLIIQPEQEK